MSKLKCQMTKSNGEISGRAEKRALSANQRFFRQVLGTKERLRRFLQRSRRWNARKKIFERRGASFFEASSERLEAEGEMSNVKAQMSKGKIQMASDIRELVGWFHWFHWLNWLKMESSNAK